MPPNAGTIRPMCGFAGQLVLEGSGALAGGELAQRMAGRLRHRGPDETGLFTSDDRRCAIGFQRPVRDRPGRARTSP